jgi:acyl-CoA synthetase (AMP-forming)/AMP-acid ligase II
MLSGHGGGLGSLMDDLTDVHGSRHLVAESEGGLRVTYRQAAKRVNRWAGGIAAVTRPGDRVVIHTPNGYEQLLLCLAASRAGTIAVPVNDQMRTDEVDHVVADSQAALTIRNPLDVDGARPLETAVPSKPTDIAALFYTSGTTGTPKGAELSHRSLVDPSRPTVAWLPWLHRDEAVVSLPVAHIMGFAVLLLLAGAGVPTYFLPHFRPDEVLDAIEDRKATVFVGVPAMYRMMLEAGAERRDLTSVRIWGSGADTMPSELAARFKGMGATASLPGLGVVGEAAFVEGYGMVEVGGGVAAKVSPPLVGLGLGGGLGVPLPSWRFRVIDEAGDEVGTGQVGELLVRGPGVLSGYWHSPEASAEVLTDDGWLRTGDLVRRGPLGTVSFVGRAKEVVKHGGYSVYSLEVQQVIEGHPGVAEAAVLGLPDERFGELPVAVVRAAEGAVLDPDELVAWAAEHLADYKAPRQIVVVDDLPRTGTRKVVKDRLLDLFDVSPDGDSATP